MNYKRYENENEIAYIYRICEQKEAIGTWEDVKDILNENLGYTRTSSAYRKVYQSFNRIYTANAEIFSKDQQLLEDIKMQRHLMELEAIKCRDERSALRREVTRKARKESLYDLFERKIAAFEKYEVSPVTVSESECDMVVHLTDVHAGICIDNYWNTYNSKILVERLRQYAADVEQIKNRHNCKKCYLVMSGDLISGLIHFGVRIENRENVVEQIICVSEAIAQFIADIAKLFDEIQVVSVAGNHSRAVANKDNHIKGEDFDNLVPFYLKAKLQNYTNVKFVKNEIDESIGKFYIKNNLVYVVHGDKDSPQNVVQKLTMMTGKKPDLVYMGHRHTNAVTTVYDTKVIESGCLSGTDNFAINNRLSNKPEQTVTICNEDGLVCTYDIRLK